MMREKLLLLKVAADSIAAAIERQMMHNALRASEARYRTLFELSSEGIYRFEFEQPISLALPTEDQVDQIYCYMYIAEVNAAFAAMYGIADPREMVGSRLIDLHVEDSERNQAFERAVVQNGHCIRNVLNLKKSTAMGNAATS